MAKAKFLCMYGGKGMLVGKLLPLLPPHHTYVEVFGGTATLLFAKTPSPVEVYNDIDGDLVNLFRVVRDPQKFEEFLRKVSLTLYSREEWQFCNSTYATCEDDVERAYRFYVALCQSFAGTKNGWGFARTKSYGGMSETTHTWLSRIEGLPEVHARLQMVQIERKDFREILGLYDTSDTLFYCDPPYVLETRRLRKAYPHEMTLEDHRDLVKLLLKLRGMALLSGYAHSVYAPLEQSGWTRVDFEVSCHAAGRTRQTGILGEGATFRKNQRRVESIWISPSAWERLGTKPLLS